MRTWMMGLALASMLAWLLGGCAKSAGTETGNPPFILRTLVQVSAADAETVTVAGEAGAVTPGGGEVEVENQRTGARATVDVAADGSFRATLAGAPDDGYTLVAVNDGVSSEPQVVGPTASEEGWTRLHACADDDPMDPLSVNGVSVDGDTMSIEVFHAGGCEEHRYGLCYEEEWAESAPIQLGFRVLHDGMGDMCDAGLTETLRFDLTAFKQAYERAYRTEEGAASISLAPCASGGECSVLYEWGPLDCDGEDCAPVSLPTPPSGWVRHDTPCMLSFEGPADLVEAMVQGTDSCVLEFKGAGCLVGGGRGGFSSGLSRDGIDAREAYSRVPTLVDGREASFVTATTDSPDQPFFAGLHVPLGTSSIGGISAELYFYCATSEARDALIPALGTVQIEGE